MNIGDYINQYLQDKNLSQRQFAKQSGLSNGYISMLINKVNPKTGKPLTPSLTALLSLSKGMGISLDKFLQEIDDITIDISSNSLSQLLGKETSSIDNEFLQILSTLSDEDKEWLLDVIKSVIDRRK